MSEADSGLSAIGSGGRTAPTAHGPLPTALLLERARAALDTVTDPELPFLTIRDLGILREVRIGADGVLEVVITPTYSGCPANDIIALDIATALARAGLEPHHIAMARAPAWTTDWITADGRAKLATNGIAPPDRAAGKRALFAPEAIACPHCGAADTEEVSAFGSTACKAHRRCLSCREPFEAFKCI